MKKYELLLELLPIIYPVFYVKKDKEDNELVFLDTGHHQEDISVVITDKTQCEAVENHIHLFNRVNEGNKEVVKKIGFAIARNLFRALVQTFPDKKFIVYLEVNIKDSTIVRFHQIWDNEPLYFDVKQLNLAGSEIFEFKT